MRPGPFKQTFVFPSQWGSIWNLASIGPLVSEEMFEIADIHTYMHTRIHKYIRTYGRWRRACPISSPVSLRLRWAGNAYGSSDECSLLGEIYRKQCMPLKERAHGLHMYETERESLGAWTEEEAMARFVGSGLDRRFWQDEDLQVLGTKIRRSLNVLFWCMEV